MDEIHHQPNMAARKAEQFANVTLVQHNLEQGYALLSPNTRNSLTFDQFKDVISKMHSSDYPLFVRATEHEPLMGQKAMNIYLLGEAEKKRLYYRLVMEGTEETDYLVGGFWRNDNPYPPPNNRRSL